MQGNYNYAAQVRDTIMRFFHSRHSGSGVGRVTQFRQTREMVRSQVQHVRRHQRFFASGGDSQV